MGAAASSARRLRVLREVFGGVPELILLGCAHGRRPRKRSPTNDTLRGLEGTRIDCPENVDMLNRFQN